ncbi:DUF397 domain-containing protein [Nocardiopsis dassonvillei]
MGKTTMTPEYRKSSYSTPQSQNCVEVADLPTETRIRDTQNREAGHLGFAPGVWTAFLAAAERDAQ